MTKLGIGMYTVYPHRANVNADKDAADQVSHTHEPGSVHMLYYQRSRATVLKSSLLTGCSEQCQQ